MDPRRRSVPIYGAAAGGTKFHFSARGSMNRRALDYLLCLSRPSQSRQFGRPHGKPRGKGRGRSQSVGATDESGRDCRENRIVRATSGPRADIPSKIWSRVSARRWPLVFRRDSSGASTLMPAAWCQKSQRTVDSPGGSPRSTKNPNDSRAASRTVLW
jgi:hypothetical protein